MLAEIGIQHSGRSKLVDEFRDMDFDEVVTVCDSAARDDIEKEMIDLLSEN